MLSRLVGKKIIRRRSSRLLVSIQCSCLCIMVCSGHWIPNHCKLGAMRVLNSSIQLPSASVAELYPGLARSNVTSSLVSLLKELNQTRMEEPDCFLGFLGDSLMSDTMMAMTCELIGSLGYGNRSCMPRIGGNAYYNGENFIPCDRFDGSLILEHPSPIRKVCPKIKLVFKNVKNTFLNESSGRNWLINWGVHCNNRACLDRYNSRLVPLLRNALQNNAMRLFWVETAAQHFDYGITPRDGLFKSGSKIFGCGPITSPNSSINYRNQIVEETMRANMEHPLSIIHVFEETVPLWSFHGTQDCTHFAYFPQRFKSYWDQISHHLKRKREFRKETLHINMESVMKEPAMVTLLLTIILCGTIVLAIASNATTTTTSTIVSSPDEDNVSLLGCSHITNGLPLVLSEGEEECVPLSI